MNEFSILCRVIGSLFNRQPQDPLLVPLFTMLREGKLKAQWPLEQDELLTRLQQNSDPQALAADYNALFVGSECSVPPYASQWPNGPQEADVRAFLSSRGMPLSDAPADHFGVLLLAASWLEDQSAEDEFAAQLALFDDYLLPWCGAFLGKVEAHATSAFYRTLAALSREAIQAMYDELNEGNDEEA
ncbi:MULTISPECIES: molecular chaperone [Pantoea]|jgi:TorA maturation chaperone TorD|uniref:Molecular chaperone n=1 Tax=Candidatus Pantoea communis TaxID=2608354 RepID=A0ABX0RME7_9GAMM|nr:MULTISPECIES: molecular chaperone [Pantoea]MDF7628338.1 molecular chaperone [Erwiniaceae bacterium L1_55_4]MXP51774.1 molecular chaperone [Pantoea sp. Seng]MXP58892.1 molecular chaperone [Pantoea sp. Taur]NIG17658.1 molecular chaperone [Pantoea communis]SNY75005.1 chaperone TorD involved in molybdoenzyme TorA maturation [Pantoea sp. GL120224-02]